MRIELLKDIEDAYYDTYFKKGDIINLNNSELKPFNSNSVNKIIKVHGHGTYTYAHEGEYKII